MIRQLVTHKYNFLDLMTCSAATSLFISEHGWWAIFVVVVGIVVSCTLEFCYAD